MTCVPAVDVIRRERGVTGLEYAGLIAVAVLVVGAIVAGIGGRQAPQVRAALCKAMNSIFQLSGSCDSTSTTEPPPESFIPEECKQTETGQQVNSAISIAFIKIGEDAGFIETVYSDGTVEMTATNGGSLGLTVGLGGELSVGNFQAGAKVDFGGGFSVDSGSTWVFKNQAEADSMRKQLDDYLLQQVMMRTPTPNGMPIIILNPVMPPKPPTQMVATLGSYEEAALDLGLNPRVGPAKETHATIPGAGVVGEVSRDSKWVIMTDTEANTRTYTTDISYDNSGQLTGGLSVVGLNAKGGSSISVTKDANNKIINVTIVTTNEGGQTTGKSGEVGVSGPEKPNGQTKEGEVGGGSTTSNTQATVVTTSLDIDPNNAEQQQLAGDWLSGNSDMSSIQLISPLVLNPVTKVPGDAFQNLLFERAKVQSVTYDNVTNVTEFGLHVKIGIALGFEASLEDSTSTAVAAQYLQGPGSDGSRTLAPYTECVK